MQSDHKLKLAVIEELEWDPAVKATQVGVAVKDAVVTLTGHLETFTEKSAVEQAVKRVQGVQAIAVEIDVKMAPDHKLNDTEIAVAAEAAFKCHSQIPAERIQLTVERGWVTLKGDVSLDSQRQAATKAVRTLPGVAGVSNYIRINQDLTPGNVSARIREALTRHAEREAQEIEVEINGAEVTLRGVVESWSERTVAFGAAWTAPGISNVVNEIRVIS